MRRGSTFFLKSVVIMIGIAVLSFCAFWLPWISNRAAEINPGMAYLQYPVLIGVYATAVPFYFALYQALKILSYIDGNKAFSELSVNALKSIKYSALAIGILYAAGTPALLLSIGDMHIQVAAIGSLATLASTVIAVFAAVLQRLLQDAIDIKSENDLTI